MTGIRRHDRYVLRAFWGAFLAILVFFTVITLLLHLTDRLALLFRYWERIEARGFHPPLVIVEYYATLLPFIWQQVIPFAAVLGAAFALSRLRRHGELSPLVTSGVSTRRITLPLLLAGLLLGGLQFAMQELLVPKLSRRNLLLERLLTKGEADRISRVPHFADPGGARVSVGAFRPADARLENAVVTVRQDDADLSEVRVYPEIRWADGEGRWIADRDGTLFVVPDGLGALQRSRIPADAALPLEASLDLYEVTVLKNAALGLSAGETRALLAVDPDNARLRFRLHQLHAQILVPLVLLLMGVPFCLGDRRSGGGMKGTIAVLAACAIYYGTTYVTSSFVGGGGYNVAWLAWFPVVNFGSLGLGNWLLMRS